MDQKVSLFEGRDELDPLNKKEKMTDKDGAYSTIRPVCLGLLLACASNFQIGYSITYMNTPVEEFKLFLNKSYIDRGYGPLSETQYDFIWNVFLNIWLVGFGCAVWLNPFFNDKIGRKRGFFIMSLLSALGSILRFLGIFTEFYELLLLGQFLASVAVGVTYQSLILMLQECAPTRLRGLLSCISEICVALFSVFGTLIGMKSIFGTNLRLLVGSAIIPSVIGVFILVPMKESPKFLLIIRRDKPAAIRSIHYYHGKPANADNVIKEIEKECEKDMKSPSFMKIFRSAHIRKAIFLGCLALQMTTVLWVLFFSSTYFLRQVDIEESLAELSSTALVCLYLIGSSLGCVFVEKFGRRKLLLPSALISLIFLTTYVVCAVLQPRIPWIKYGCVGSLWLYTIVYGFGVGPICWFLLSELTPQKMRSRVQVSCYFLNMIICTILTSSILPLYKMIGPPAFIILYVLPCSFALIILYFQLPETKNKEIHEIVAELKHEATMETILLET